MDNVLDSLCFSVFDRSLRVYCNDGEAIELLLANYGEMQASIDMADLNYTVERDKTSRGFIISREDQKSLTAKQGGDFLYTFEQDVTVQLQKLRHDLYFLHSAVLEFEGKACAFVGTNKSGKSTLTWALLHHDFHYLSDELGPVDPKSLHVYPYPRALWLRREPPGSHQLPSRKLQTSWMLCVPTESLAVRTKPTPLRAIFFVRYNPAAVRPLLRLMRKVEAAAQLLANTLNPGAHSGDGLDAAIEIATRARSYELVTAGLPETCAIVTDALIESV